MSEIKRDVVDEIIKGIERLMDLIEDVEKWQDFAERMDRARNGEIGDPVELMQILIDLLDYLADKVPMGPLEKLMKRLLKVATGALEAGALFTKWLLLLRYRQLRENGHSPEEASKHATNDKAAQAWLRLREKMDEEGKQDKEVEDNGESVKDAIPELTFPREPKPRWPEGHCCTKNDNAQKAPELNPEISKTSVPHITGSNPHEAEYEMIVKYEASHPCGIHRVFVRAFTRGKQVEGSPPPPWHELPKGSALFRSSRRPVGKKGTKGTIKVRASAELILTYRVYSKCGTSVSKVIKIKN